MIKHTGSSYEHDYVFEAGDKLEAMTTAWKYWTETKYRCADMASLDYDPTEAAMIRESRKRCIKMLKKHKVTRSEMQEFIDGALAGRRAAETLVMMRDLIAGQDQLGSSNESVMLRLWEFANKLKKDTRAHQEAVFIINGYFGRVRKQRKLEHLVGEMKRRLERK